MCRGLHPAHEQDIKSKSGRDDSRITPHGPAMKAPSRTQSESKAFPNVAGGCKVQMGSAFTAVGMGGASVLAQGDAERSWVAVVCMFAAIGILGSFVGIRSGGDLSRAFEEQAKKKSGAGL